MSEPINIVFSVSPGFTPITVVAMTSLLMNTSRDVDFHILDCDITPLDQKNLSSLCKKFKNCHSVNFYYVNCIKEFEGCNNWRGFLDCWARFAFPSFAPPTCKKAFYLDSDVLVLGDIAKLYDIDMQGYALAASPEMWHKTNEKVKFLRKKAFEYPDTNIYFGSGMLLMDVTKWQHDNIGEKLIELGREYGSIFEFPDQDALNMYFKENYLPLDTLLCCTSEDIIYYQATEPEKLAFLEKNLIVQHFSADKPDRSSMLHAGMVKMPHYDLWWWYALQTEFANYFIALKKHS